MRENKILYLIIFVTALLTHDLYAQIGYYDAPYVRYEANQGTLVNASSLGPSHNQSLLQSEASEQVCVNMTGAGASVSWTVTADGDGLVVRYSVPDGQSGVLEVYANSVLVGTMNLSSYYSWEYLSTNMNPNNVGVINGNPKMRFDEVRFKLPSKILTGGNLKLVRQSGNIYLDFAELESVPPVVASSGGNVIYGGNGSDLQNVINLNGGATIYLPPGVYNVNNELYFGVNNTVLKGAGMWYTQINFTNGSANSGGLRANASGVSYSGLYLTTTRNSRSSSYKAINGVYTGTSSITNVWAEHFECGAWIGQYNTGGPGYADGFTVSNCRFRNNYADGINLCRGTRNTIVEHCSFRNNGDDDMAIWSADNMECQNNTFRYNTSENCWRASGCAIYGGLNNKAQNLLIKDNLEVGIRVGNNFGGAPFNGGGMHEFTNIRIVRCGTYNDLFNTPVGAIDLLCTNVAGNRVSNVKFSCIDIIDSRNDAIYIKKNSGDGFYNLVFENISVVGTGTEYPNNNAGSGNGGVRGYGLLFWGSPSGNGTYCNMTYANRGGNAPSDVNTSQIGSFSWSAAGSCPTGCNLSTSSTNVTSPAYFGVCNNPVSLTATSTPPSGNTVNYIEFFVDAVSIGQDNSSPYSVAWNTPTIGTHSVIAVAHYSPSNTTAASTTQTLTIADGIYSTATAPVIDGTIDAVWGSYNPFSLNTVAVGTVGGAADLSATFQITRDATYLYILANITDETIVSDGGNTYDNDGIEFFIDMGNNKSGTYGTNDFAYSFVANSGTITESKHSAVAGVTIAQGAKTGGYIMEIRIPWSTLGGAPASGDLMGFDLHVNDDDDGFGRDAKKVWKDGTDNAWQWPSVLGTLQIAGCSGPLPVNLLEFTGSVINETIVLNWTTVAEHNNERFIVERSVNQYDWEQIGNVNGVGNTNTVSHYSFTDYALSNGTVYYRLRQVDVDGEFSHSNIVAIDLNSIVLSISPNPFDETFTVSGDLTGIAEIIVYDLLGRIVYQLSQTSVNGNLIIQPSLTQGVYMVTIQTEESIWKSKVIQK